MNILHYTLGLPPYRSGGLTKYATDLMLSQSNAGDKVSLLYPGDYTFWKKAKISISENESFNGLAVFEIKNPSPVPLLHGVKNPRSIFSVDNQLSNKVLEDLYTNLRPEIFHVHTLMGLPHELLVFFKEKGVKILYTTHDYYGLCPKVNFINQDGLFCEKSGGESCAICNDGSASPLFLRLRNSKYLLKYKEQLSSNKVKAIGAQSQPNIKNSPTREKSEEYVVLLDYYQRLFKLVDCFHYNSSVTKSIYDQYITPKQAQIISISHSGIKDSRQIKSFDENHIRLAFIGSLESYKGFPMLKEVLEKLQGDNKCNWTLDVWGGAIGTDEDCNRITYRGKFSSDELQSVYEGMDLLIVPSIWKETFSLIALEAISYGVPVLVSSNVGAKDIIKEYDSEFVFTPSKEALFSKLESVLSKPSALVDFNEKIISKEFDHSLSNHILKIEELYKSILSKK